MFSFYHSLSKILIIIVSIFLILSFVVSILISRRYLRPITDALDIIKIKDFTTDQGKTSYLEINDLMDFLAQQDEITNNRTISITDSPDNIAMMKVEMYRKQALNRILEMDTDELLKLKKVYKVRKKPWNLMSQGFFLTISYSC